MTTTAIIKLDENLYILGLMAVHFFNEEDNALLKRHIQSQSDITHEQNLAQSLAIKCMP